LNYITLPQVILVGPAWSLVIEVCFYLLALLLLPLMRARRLHPVYLPVAMLVVTGLSVVLSRNLGANFFLLSVSLSYLPILAIGALFYLYEAGLISSKIAFSLAALAWITFLTATANIYPKFLTAGMESYPISVMASIALFCLCFAKRDRLSCLPSAMSWIALASYSIYLWHGVVALPLEHALLPRIGFTAALVVSLVALVSVAWLSYIGIEKPFQTLAKKIV
jgi:peptidoglycan/LPS O-acetylase OafA/YrhL